MVRGGPGRSWGRLKRGGEKVERLEGTRSPRLTMATGVRFGAGIRRESRDYFRVILSGYLQRAGPLVGISIGFTVSDRQNS
eukprot:1357292-Amorphochlora_amoeboformis.AAC.2